MYRGALQETTGVSLLQGVLKSGSSLAFDEKGGRSSESGIEEIKRRKRKGTRRDIVVSTEEGLETFSVKAKFTKFLVQW